MIGQIFMVFRDSLAESHKLENRCRAATTRLGWVTVALGCAGIIPLMYYCMIFYGLPLEGGSIEGRRLNVVAFAVTTIVFFPLVLYLAMIVIYGLYGLLMYLMRKFTWQQTVEFALFAKYPEHWYRQDA